jgi:hypothetical protein
VIIFSGANPIIPTLVAVGACLTIAEPPESRTDANDGLFQQCFAPMAAETDARAEGRRWRNSRRQDIPGGANNNNTRPKRTKQINKTKQNKTQ